MIINIRQLSSNIKQEYLIDGDFSCRGKLGSFNRFQRITLSAQNQLLYAKYHFKNPINYIPLIDMLGFNKLSRVFHIYDSTGFCGEFLYTEHGFAQKHYIIKAHDLLLPCYEYSHDKFNYISVYLGETQIALIETYLVVNDLKYKHKIYLLDDYENLKEILALFVLYYANYNFTKRFHMSAGVFTTKSFAYSKYKDKYSPSWQRTNFPNDNFWGKTNLYN